MKERPILFSAPMVRAILEGRKKQTRRVVKPIPQMVTDRNIVTWDGDAAALMRLLDQVGRSCPYGNTGDRLWVRETWRIVGNGPDDTIDMFDRDDIQYRADDDQSYIDKYRPSIHMPRWASRILLEIAGVRVERLQDISEADVLAEGFVTQEGRGGSEVFQLPEWGDNSSLRNISAAQAYRALWSSINGAGSWGANPWVWVVEFKRLEGGAA